MPRFGTLNLKQFAAPISEIHGYKTESLTLKGANILNLAVEIDDVAADNLLPPAMHPAIPAYAIINVVRFPESPVGAFSVAEVRVAGRAGVRPRGFVLRSYVDNEAAARELARRWGYPVSAGSITLDLRHDRVRAQVIAGDRVVLECELLDRDAISGADIQYIASMHLARNKEDGKVVLVQVDPEYVFSRAERGKPRVITLDPQAWNTGGNLILANPIAASFAVCDVTLPKLRYVVDPERPAYSATTKVAA